jgi:hypothetical protein
MLVPSSKKSFNYEPLWSIIPLSNFYIIKVIDRTFLYIKPPQRGAPLAYNNTIIVQFRAIFLPLIK